MDYYGFLGKEEKTVVKDKESRLEHYKEVFAKDEYIQEFRFSRCDFSVGLFGYDGDVEIFLPVDEVMHPRAKKESYVTFANLDRVYTLKVLSIDEEKKRVTVSFFKAQEKLRDAEVLKIDEELANGKHPVRKGVIYGLMLERETGYRRACIVDILGLGIYATLNVRDWSGFFTPDLAAVVKQGDVIEVAVTGKTVRAGMNSYTCSRKECVKEDTEEFAAKFPVKSGVTIKCIHRENNRFVGQVVGYDDVFCYCYYPAGRRIKLGACYTGYVRDSTPGKPLKVSIGDEL